MTIENMLITMLFIWSGSTLLDVIASIIFPEIDLAVKFMIVSAIIWIMIFVILLLSKRP